MNTTHALAPADSLPLAEVLDIRQAEPLAKALLSRRGQDLTLDASTVRRVGGLCLQVLLSADAAWKSDGQTLAVAQPTVAFLEGLTLAGASCAA